MTYPKRLIEVDLPIKRISAHARREQCINKSHIKIIHTWWARRPLAAIVVSPSSAQIKPGIKQTFVAKGFNQHGRDFSIKSVKWTTTGGAMDKDGVFSAGKDEGSFVVTATAGEINGTATCIIAIGGKPPPPPPPRPTAGKLVWTGEVPPQKWMNFYTKVLSKFAARKGLKLTVTVEASPEGGVTKQQAEETKTALRELGLSAPSELLKARLLVRPMI